MRLFRRRETLNEQLLREAGVVAEPVAAPAPEPELPDGPVPWFPDGLRRSRLGGGLGIPGIRAVPGLPGEQIVVTRRDGTAQTLVDGAAHPPLAALDAIAEDEDFAERLDGDWWELQVSAL